MADSDSSDEKKNESSSTPGTENLKGSHSKHKKVHSDASANKSKASSSAGEVRGNFDSQLFDYEDDSGRFEAWSIRVPIEMDLQNLDGCQLKISKDGKGFELMSEDNQYMFQFGHKTENEAFRFMSQKTATSSNPDNADDDDSDDDGNGKTLSISAKTLFHRHINVIDMNASHFPKESELAPAPESAPEPDATTAANIRKGYAPRPPKTGLKRRWMPTGCSVSPFVIVAETMRNNFAHQKIDTHELKRVKKEEEKVTRAVDYDRDIEMTDAQPQIVKRDDDQETTEAITKNGTKGIIDKDNVIHHESHKKVKKAKKEKKVKKEKKIKKEKEI